MQWVEAFSITFAHIINWKHGAIIIKLSAPTSEIIFNGVDIARCAISNHKLKWDNKAKVNYLYYWEMIIYLVFGQVN